MSIRVLLADDHQIMRQSLASLLGQQADFDVVGEATDGRSLLKQAMRIKPDVVVMDISMPELNGIDATRKLKSELESTKVLALSMHSEKRLVTEMLKAGASGYLLKDCAFEELATAIRTVQDNKVYLSPSIAGMITDEFILQSSDATPSVYSQLSAREREVLQLIAEGKSTRNISEKIHVSIKTVESHRANIMHKLHLKTIADLTKYAIREGLTTLD